MKTVGKIWLALVVFALAAPMYAEDSSSADTQTDTKTAAAKTSAADQDFDNYKWRIDALWYYAKPSGTISGQAEQVPIDLSKDLSFNSYSTVTGKVDWRITHKNHLMLGVTPLYSSSKNVTLDRTIIFQGVTYEAGATISTSLHSTLWTPGYRYDIIRRNHGAVGIDAYMYLIDTSASINGTATISSSEGESQTATVKASGSLLAPIPVFGPSFYWYPMKESPKLTLEGNILGMYLFGYGNFMSTHATVGYAFNPHWNVRFGYILSNRLSVHGTSSRIALDMTQQGPTVGIEYTGGHRDR